MSKRLPHTLENVCLSTDEDCAMYAVGSKAHTDLLDSRTLQVSNSTSTSAVLFCEMFTKPVSSLLSL